MKTVELKLDSELQTILVDKINSSFDEDELYGTRHIESLYDHDGEGRTPFILFTHYDVSLNEEEVNFLISKTNFQHIDVDGNTPLFHAILNPKFTENQWKSIIHKSDLFHEPYYGYCSLIEIFKNEKVLAQIGNENYNFLLKQVIKIGLVDFEQKLINSYSEKELFEEDGVKIIKTISNQIITKIYGNHKNSKKKNINI